MIKIVVRFWSTVVGLINYGNPYYNILRFAGIYSWKQYFFKFSFRSSAMLGISYESYHMQEPLLNQAPGWTYLYGVYQIRGSFWNPKIKKITLFWGFIYGFYKSIWVQIWRSLPFWYLKAYSWAFKNFRELIKIL